MRADPFIAHEIAGWEGSDRHPLAGTLGAADVHAGDLADPVAGRVQAVGLVRCWQHSGFGSLLRPVLLVSAMRGFSAYRFPRQGASAAKGGICRQNWLQNDGDLTEQARAAEREVSTAQASGGLICRASRRWRCRARARRSCPGSARWPTLHPCSRGGDGQGLSLLTSATCPRPGPLLSGRRATSCDQQTKGAHRLWSPPSKTVCPTCPVGAGAGRQ